MTVDPLDLLGLQPSFPPRRPSDLRAGGGPAAAVHPAAVASGRPGAPVRLFQSAGSGSAARLAPQHHSLGCLAAMRDRHLSAVKLIRSLAQANGRSVEHTFELQSLMRFSYAVFCLKQHHIFTLYTYFLSNYLTKQNRL